MYTSHLILFFCEMHYYEKTEISPGGGLIAFVSEPTGMNDLCINTAASLLDQLVNFSAEGELSRISRG